MLVWRVSRYRVQGARERANSPTVDNNARDTEGRWQDMARQYELYGGINMDNGNRLKGCPTCGRAFPPVVEVGGKRRQAMFDYIAKHPEGVTVWQTLDAVYADDPSGGPTDHNVVSVMKLIINRRLEKLGLSARIKSTGGGSGAVYRLVEE
jgi:hypothetical protein